MKHDTLFVLKLQMSAQKCARLGLQTAERLYRIPCTGPVNLNHPVFHTVRQIMAAEGIAFDNDGLSETPLGYTESWWTEPLEAA